MPYSEGLGGCQSWVRDGVMDVENQSEQFLTELASIYFIYLFLGGEINVSWGRLIYLKSIRQLFGEVFFIIIIYLFYFKAPFLFLSIGQGQIRSTILIYNKRIFSLQ